MQLSGSKPAGMLMVFNGCVIQRHTEFELNQSLGFDAFLARSGIIIHEITQKFTFSLGGLWD